MLRALGSTGAPSDPNATTKMEYVCPNTSPVSVSSVVVVSIVLEPLLPAAVWVLNPDRH